MEEIATAIVQATEVKKAGRPAGSKNKVSFLGFGAKGLFGRNFLAEKATDIRMSNWVLIGCPRGLIAFQREISRAIISQK